MSERVVAPGAEEQLAAIASLSLPNHPVVWSAEPLRNERRELGGVNSRTIPLALLGAGKSSPREGVAEAAKDRFDAQALSGLEP